MDYKYIEQLLERYWQCATSEAEETILRAFFSQADIPAQLQRYRSLFDYTAKAAGETTLGEDFDKRILAMTEQRPEAVKARTITLRHRLMPLFKAAAIVAIIVTIGNAVQRPMQREDSSQDDINYANYSDTYSDPAMAYDQMHDALELISEGMASAMTPDTTINANAKAHQNTTHAQ